MIWRSQGPRRWFRIMCMLMTGCGIAGMLDILVFPPERYDETGHLIGEMPPEFALAFHLVTFGIAGAIAGFVVPGLERLTRRVRTGKTIR